MGFGTYRWTGRTPTTSRRCAGHLTRLLLVDTAPNYAPAEVRSRLGQVPAPHRPRSGSSRRAAPAGRRLLLDPPFLREPDPSEARTVGRGHLDAFLVHNPEHPPEGTTTRAGGAGPDRCGVRRAPSRWPPAPSARSASRPTSWRPQPSPSGSTPSTTTPARDRARRRPCASLRAVPPQPRGAPGTGERSSTGVGPRRDHRPRQPAAQPAPPTGRCGSRTRLRGPPGLHRALARAHWHGPAGLGWLVQHWDEVASPGRPGLRRGPGGPARRERPGAVGSRRTARDLIAARRRGSARRASARTRGSSAPPASADLAGEVGSSDPPRLPDHLRDLDHVRPGPRRVADVDQLAALLATFPGS